MEKLFRTINMYRTINNGFTEDEASELYENLRKMFVVVGEYPTAFSDEYKELLSNDVKLFKLAMEFGEPSLNTDEDYVLVDVENNDRGDIFVDPKDGEKYVYYSKAVSRLFKFVRLLYIQVIIESLSKRFSNISNNKYGINYDIAKFGVSNAMLDMDQHKSSYEFMSPHTYNLFYTNKSEYISIQDYIIIKLSLASSEIKQRGVRYHYNKDKDLVQLKDISNIAHDLITHMEAYKWFLNND